MKNKGSYQKYQNEILAAVFLAAAGILIGVCFDYYYALNDDVMIRDILSGLYSGVPETRNNQMLYPLSVLLALFYRCVPGIPWYGIFMWVCHFGCLFLILRRCLSWCRDFGKKLAVLAVLGILYTGLFLEHLVFTQYTITSGLMAAAAIFLFVTQPGNDRLLKRSIPSILLCWMAFLLRSEMLLLMLPFVCVAGVYRWSREEKIFTGANFKKYFSVFGCILGGLVIALVVDTAAYSGSDWKEFRRLFDARTTLYDYTGVPLYELNEEFYQENDLSEEQYALLTSYNYGLDDELDASVFETLAEHAQAGQAGLFERIRLGLVRYRYRITNLDGYPYNLLVILGYVLLLFALNRKNLLRLGFTVGFQLAVRSVVWVYILMTNRIPVRITHSLYFAEFLLLAGICAAEMLSRKRNEEIADDPEKTAGNPEKAAGMPERTVGAVRCRGGVKLVCMLVLTFTAGSICAVSGWRETLSQSRTMEENNRANEALLEYCGEHPENFYFMDVYSSIYFSDKLFANRQQAANYELLGGWICKSPLYEEKLAAYEIRSLEEALKTRENIYLVQDVERSFDWLTDYYEAKGCEVGLQQVTVLDQWLGIYQVEITPVQ